MKRTYIIIPALEPESGLCRQIRELQEKIPSQVVVIDDGSGRDYREIFDRIEKMAGCIVLHHGENRGKGQALKTGFRYVRESAGKACRVLCLDCDGQHLPQDGVRLLRTAEKRPDTLVLGVPRFFGKRGSLEIQTGKPDFIRPFPGVQRHISGRYSDRIPGI